MGGGIASIVRCICVPNCNLVVNSDRDDAMAWC